jgi:lipoate-protein ligase A
MQWILLTGGDSPGDVNMKVDESTARALADGVGGPALRLYGWKPWAISLGHHQNIAEIDVDRAAADGIDVVRRPTGGRAILHAEELTYCVVMPADRRSVLDAYNEISAALIEGLRLFGVETTLQKSQPRFSDQYRDPTSVSCFSSSARYEIEWRGRKIVGSAQRRFSGRMREVVLQHGSILCGPAHLRLAEYLRMGDRRTLERAAEALRRHTTDLSAVTGRSVDRDRLAMALQEGFERAWKVQFVPAPFAVQPFISPVSP